MLYSLTGDVSIELAVGSCRASNCRRAAGRRDCAVDGRVRSGRSLWVLMRSLVATNGNE